MTHEPMPLAEILCDPEVVALLDDSMSFTLSLKMGHFMEISVDRNMGGMDDRIRRSIEHFLFNSGDL